MDFDDIRPKRFRGREIYKAQTEPRFGKATIEVTTGEGLEGLILGYVRTVIAKHARRRTDIIPLALVENKPHSRFYPDGYQGFAHFSLTTGLMALAENEIPFIAKLKDNKGHRHIFGYRSPGSERYLVDEYNDTSLFYLKLSLERYRASAEAKRQILKEGHYLGVYRRLIYPTGILRAGVRQKDVFLAVNAETK